ncbi:isoprenylcysteine carboxylmethyltransferase family protein [Bradyrhizobium sp. Arg68]|uniref:methyltransferase family protein n=1 Tax=Bradyrhizobium ivorense TaxID=2511166 RepID=UPI001E5112F4|nr:isoprenylcysteine carboxylmethyltransferase family protein [Bradyrhizobium ivorense]MCC8942950.1 isoprenylcysteine carboxylmethyltransferase family protein [Bradyrhizobium ivorense]
MTSVVDPKPMSRAMALLYGISLPLMLLALVFVPAGDIGWRPGWIFVAALVAGFGLSALLLAKVNPMIYRARSRIQPGTKTWDLILLSVMLPVLVLEIPIAALDAGRMGWSTVPPAVVVLGYLLFVGSIVITTWAQAVNPFFEPGVRIQQERAQRVITSGPYGFVRHPGYTAAIAMFIAIPLALGSWWGLLPAALAIVLLVIRTRLEDGLLQAELPGYADYASRTRYRLLPGVW